MQVHKLFKKYKVPQINWGSKIFYYFCRDSGLFKGNYEWNKKFVYPPKITRFKIYNTYNKMIFNDLQ